MGNILKTLMLSSLRYGPIQAVNSNVIPITQKKKIETEKREWKETKHIYVRKEDVIKSKLHFEECLLAFKRNWWEGPNGLDI